MKIKWHIQWLDSVASTNNSVKDLVVAGQAEEGLVIASREQTSGKGRGNNHWFSQKDMGLYFSFLLQPTLPLSCFSDFSVFTGSVLQEYLSGRFPGIAFSVKEPNDVLVCGKKIAGILVETVNRGNKLGGIITGIGVNLNHTGSDFPDHLRDFSVSMRQLTGELLTFDRVTELMEGYLEYFSEQYGGRYEMQELQQ